MKIEPVFIKNILNSLSGIVPDSNNKYVLFSEVGILQWYKRPWIICL